MPQRIQRKRTKGWRMPPGVVYVGRGRGTRYGNPFRVSQVGREEAIRRYRCEVLPLLDLTPLRGKDLCCWCRLDEACHADLPLEEANK